MKLLKKFKLNLTTAIFIALGAGALLGIALNLWIPKTEFVQNIIVDGVFYVLGNGFISLMKMLVVPLVFCSLVTGASAMGDGKALGSVGLKTVLFYLLTT
ncbi:MAG: cation:dicarboxylase symporter family transporter, partial [Ileibacterium sp.]|nr:cation:dicarboxylase symporter family transporter [Ileibacterium sp.]